MIPADLLEILRCPATRQPLAMAPAEVLARVNAGRSEPILAGLVRADGKMLYPIRDRIPVLLVDEAISL